MGLDFVELIMEVEDTFGIKIYDDDAGAMRTVGDLYRYVLEKLTLRECKTCESARAYRNIRKSLVTLFNVERRSVRPSTPMEQLVPKRGRRKAWSDLERDLECSLPELARHGALVLGLTLLVLGGVVYGAHLTFATFGFSLGLLFAVFTGGVLLAVFAAILFQMLTTPCAVNIPWRCADMRALVNVMVRHNMESNKKEDEGFTREQVWNVLSDLIVEERGCRPDEVTESASFVKDLGMD